ncbi:MAG: c-type cytochrome domain-containing protein [Syntrophothermus sp.]
MKYFSLIIFIVLLFTGCKDTGVDVDEKTIPALNVSFSQDIQPVLERHCVACHNESTKEGDLSLTTHVNITRDPGVVFPGEPQNSRLVWRIDPQYGMALMPPIGSPYKPLNANQIEGIKTWIKEGAKNN